MSGPVQFKADRLMAAMGGAAPDPLDENEPIAPPRKAANKSKPPTPKNIVSLAKARLREVKRELRRMKALEKESAELERLIAAAETPRVTLVKRSAG